MAKSGWKHIPLLAAAWAILCTFTVFVQAAGQPDEGWMRVQIGTLFTIEVPPGSAYKPGRGADARTGTITVPGGPSLQFDYGRYADPLAEAPGDQDYLARDVVIDGQPAKIVTAYTAQRSPARPHLAGVHFPALPVSPSTTARLTLAGFSRDCPDYPLVERMFMSIRFVAAEGKKQQR